MSCRDPRWTSILLLLSLLLTTDAALQARDAKATAGARRELLPCDTFPPGDPEGHFEHCVELSSSGDYLVQAEVLASLFPQPAEEAPGEEPLYLPAVVIEGQLYFVNRFGATERAFFYDNGPDPFVQGRARIEHDGKIGFVDIDLQPIGDGYWDFAFPFDHGTARVCTGCRFEPVSPGDEHSVPVGGQWGRIDLEGRVVVEVAYALDELPAGP